MKNFDFASPSQYSDWAQYAGFNRTTGEVEGLRPVEQGVPPPGNLSEMINQRLGSVQGVIGAVAPAMGQLGTGDVMGAANTMRQVRNPAQATAPTAPATTVAPMTGYDYTHGLNL